MAGEAQLFPGLHGADLSLEGGADFVAGAGKVELKEAPAAPAAAIEATGGDGSKITTGAATLKDRYGSTYDVKAETGSTKTFEFSLDGTTAGDHDTDNGTIGSDGTEVASRVLTGLSNAGLNDAEAVATAIKNAINCVSGVRGGLGATRNRLGALCGLTGGAISSYENGVTIPKRAALSRIAGALGVPMWPSAGASAGAPPGRRSPGSGRSCGSRVCRSPLSPNRSPPEDGKPINGKPPRHTPRGSAF